MTKLTAVALTLGAGCCLYSCVFVPLAVSGVVGPLTGHPLIAVNGLNRPAYPTPSPTPSSASGTASASPTSATASPASGTASPTASAKPTSTTASPSPSPSKSP